MSKHLRQLPLGLAGLIKNLANGLAEPGECASHLILISLEGNGEPNDATVSTGREFTQLLVSAAYERAGSEHTGRREPTVAAASPGPSPRQAPIVVAGQAR